MYNQNEITKETLEQYLIKVTAGLIYTARDMAWNKISDNYLYILSPYNGTDKKNCFERYAVRKRINDVKEPQPLKTVMPELLDCYPDLYDIVLYLYRASKRLTVIEIEYRTKDDLDDNYRATVVNDPPMCHSYVVIPPYRTHDKKRKFDINWQNNTISNRLNIFWWRLKYRTNELIRRDGFRESIKWN
ncbi:hypothetical protein [Mucilaginibacter ginsenosidivorax]|uniref:Uncharacterized protein n=1 Tax=Mucilaginibacter ginsenosidivorax TaxID=862126 RepID=A0A5B8W3N1_9SPHI|nr:hypothetical protein [Mucilaginibacter ginsenosidivorax]QEC78464.1 hypothetical protein FSB76_21870 [Mucilaginibacter ginsenosidivorax]